MICQGEDSHEKELTLTTIRIIDPIVTTCAGPEVDFGNMGRDDDFVPVHQRQGTLDGACGLYSVFISLLIHRLVTVDELSLLHLTDPRTRLGKFTKAISRLPALVPEGIYLEELEGMIIGSFGGVMGAERSDCRGSKLFPFVTRQILQNRPVIVSVEWNTGAHAVVVVGLEYSGDGEEQKPTRFLALDPSLESPRVSAWNLAINAFASDAGRYPYANWSGPEGGHQVQFGGALSTWRKDGR